METSKAINLANVRAAFESWFTSVRIINPRADGFLFGKYRNKWVQDMWESWQASTTLHTDALQNKEAQLAESRANECTAMGYLADVRAIVGGDDFPAMVGKVRELAASSGQSVPLWSFNLLAGQVRDALHLANYIAGNIVCDSSDADKYRKARDAALRTLGDIMSSQPAPVSDEREAFEAEARRYFSPDNPIALLSRDESGNYEDWGVMLAWETWQARAAMQGKP